MAKKMFEVENLKKNYSQKEILNITDLTVNEGEIFCLVGKSGAGKSTFLRLLNLIETPDHGRLIFSGEDIDFTDNNLKLRREMAMVFQEPLLFRTNVFNNVAFGLKVRGLPKENIRKSVIKILEKINMAEYIDTPAWKLSGGEAQRISVARALVIKPKVLLLDEPFGSLDPLTKMMLQNELRSILRDLEVTVVYVTHNQSEAFEMADRIAVLENGRVLQIGEAEDILFRPSSIFVAKFFGTENIFSGRILEQSQGLAVIETGKMRFEAICQKPIGAKVSICLRPEEILLALKDGKIKDSARNHFQATIIDIILQGPAVKVKLLYKEQELYAVITRRSLDEMNLSIGDKVIGSFKATAVHVIEER